jgi:hypothetical protein
MTDRENGSGSLTKHNNRNAIAINNSVNVIGVNRTARRMGVNPRYVSDLVRKLKMPSNPEIAKKMGFRVYEIKTSVPHGAQRKKYDRLIIHKNTMRLRGVPWLKARMKEITGVEWAPLEDEMEY